MQRKNNSEVARLMEQIRAEHEAAQRGLNDLAEGVAKHKFINAHMERIWELKEELDKQVSEAEALKMLCHVLLGNEEMDETTNGDKKTKD